MNVVRTVRPWALASIGLLVVLGGATILTPAADHRDGPIFVNTAVNGQQDINDVFIFRSPSVSTNTVIIVDLVPFPGNIAPAIFDPQTTLDVNIDNNGDAVEDITFRITFGPQGAGGVQAMTVRGLPSSKFPPTGIIARGSTGINIPILGGGMLRAAVQDDPFFFDAGQFGSFIANGMGSPVRPVGQARNFFGPEVNTLAVVLEVPTNRILSNPNQPNVGVWATTSVNGVQVDRMGRPAINTALIPPIPRSSQVFGDFRNKFNSGHPRNDRRDFFKPMVVILQDVYGRSSGDATGLANFLLPDILTFNTSTPFTTNPFDGNGFPNGRRLRDDVIDLEYSLLTGGGITSDNVPDDNGDRITDGTQRPDMTFRPIAFPYIGAPNVFPPNNNLVGPNGVSQPGSAGPNP